ncbi:MAG: helix-turn-helix transcriptional regulator [Acidobacteriia bacterium]|nr:helix-turn-helix transcriptional regulator [Terriglobia bacterium]
MKKSSMRSKAQFQNQSDNVKTTGHWTAQNTDSFFHRIVFDFIAQIEKRMESVPMDQADLAQKMNLTPGRVSQKLNDPGNMTLKTIIKLSRALGMKVAVVAYDDNDPKNERGPVNSEIFNICWESMKKPLDFLSLENNIAWNAERRTLSDPRWENTLISIYLSLNATDLVFAGKGKGQRVVIDSKREYAYNKTAWRTFNATSHASNIQF